MRPVGAHGGGVMHFWSVSFRGELAFLHCYDICMCVVNKHLSSSSLFSIPFRLTSSMMRFITFLLLRLCVCVMSVVVWSSLVCL